jgi:hypothetical protein
VETPIESGRPRIERVGDSLRVTLGPQRRGMDWVALRIWPIFVSSCVDSARELISEHVASDVFPFVVLGALIVGQPMRPTIVLGKRAAC